MDGLGLHDLRNLQMVAIMLAAGVGTHLESGDKTMKLSGRRFDMLVPWLLLAAIAFAVFKKPILDFLNPVLNFLGF